jgi:acyl-CoA synthetase (AMP-forming)/AMP-acid ligase II
MQTTQSKLQELYPFIQNYLERIVKETPDAVALQLLNNIRVSYAEMDRQSNLLANHLIRDLFVGNGTLVMLFFNKSIEMVIAILAVVSSSQKSLTGH